MLPGRLLAVAAAAMLHVVAAVLVLLVPTATLAPPVTGPALRVFEVAAVVPELPPPPAKQHPPGAAASAAAPAALPASAQPPVTKMATVPAAAANAAVAPASAAVSAGVPAAVVAADPAVQQAVRDRYARQLWQHILEWKPPGATVAGTAVVQFAIDRGGALRQLALAQSSGSARLDRIALRSVRLAAPMPLPPAELGDDDLSFSLAFSFG